MVEHRSTQRNRSSVPTIRDLIREALDSGKSVRDLAAGSGDVVKFQTFQELSNRHPKQFPKDPKTIAGMSRALGYPHATIVLAYAKGLGITVETPSEFALRLPYGVDELDQEMQTALVSVARAAVNQTGSVHDESDVSTSDSPAQSSTQGPASEEQKTYFRILAARESDPETVTEWGVWGESEREILDSVTPSLQLAGYETSRDARVDDAHFDLVAHGPGGTIYFELASHDHPEREERILQKLRRAVGRRRSDVRSQPIDPVGSDWVQRALRAANSAAEVAQQLPSTSGLTETTGERLAAAARRGAAARAMALLDTLDEILRDAESVDDQHLAELSHDAFEELGRQIADIHAAINSGQFHADDRAAIAARADDIDVRRRALKDRLSTAPVSNVQPPGDTTPDPGSGVDAGDTQSSVDLAQRRGPGRTKGERIRDEFEQLGEESQVDPEEG